MKLKSWHKNTLSALTIVIVGFILFNAAFLLAAFVVNALKGIIGTPDNAAPAILSRVIYLIIILIISWIVFKSKLNTLIKSTFLTMPLMVAFVTVGITLYGQSKLLIASIGAAIVCAVVLFLKMKKLSWQYYFAVSYVAVLGLCIIFFNIQI